MEGHRWAFACANAREAAACWPRGSVATCPAALPPPSLCSAADALLGIKAVLIGDSNSGSSSGSGLMPTWAQGSDPCAYPGWEGVQCNKVGAHPHELCGCVCVCAHMPATCTYTQEQRVTSISLASKGLTGTLPHEVPPALSSLKALDLSGNALAGACACARAYRTYAACWPALVPAVHAAYEHCKLPA